MKPNSLRTAALAAPLFGIAIAYGCAPSDPTVTNPAGGTGGISTAGTTPVAGTSAAGTLASGGTGGQTTGGQTTGGSSAGTTPVGGTGGTGGATGGAGGGGGSGGASDVPTVAGVLGMPSDFGNPGWMDSWWVTGCTQKVNHDCITNANTCNANDVPTDVEQQGARTKETWMIGGTAGQHYKVTFKFNAVTEAKYYSGGKRDVATVVGDPHTNTPLDMFYRDGTSPYSHYNEIKLTIYDDKMMPVRHFFMNSAPNNGTDWENHYTFLASYQKSIVIVGGGKIVHLVQDSNCHAIDNCGPEFHDTPDCAGSRKMPAEDANSMIPSKYMDPVTNRVVDTNTLIAAYPGGSLAQPWHAQAGHLHVLSIEKTNDPVTMDYP
jgi:hypothetical protein